MADHQDGEHTVTHLRWLAACALRHGLNAAEVQAGFIPGEHMVSSQLKPGGAAWFFAWSNHQNVDPDILIKSVQGKTPVHDFVEYVTYYPDPAGCMKITTLIGSHQSESHLPVQLVTDLIVNLKLATPNYMQYARPNGQFGHMAMDAVAKNPWHQASYNQQQYQAFIAYVNSTATS